MDSRDHDEREPGKNEICRLEWIAMAMEAARRYKESEPPRRSDNRSGDDDSDSE